ncbi:unnamed protein product [Vitrella brassicaformis CCMP3155]|uniref:BBSome complex member BBS5 PH domain-containing protein n=2 Tax=Vitrella brassicaformis TaxID=1169539 RepID=A0A0G4GYZ9_VITBC|nr:unnamed protein product [Vitrella brassicaformis CCMP3155]|mmetsp:Transcript_28502/g.71173  ORF Transcript_28502/g.71173 Transcript_28502/m.71173 type:complete len:341 (+) Transcript_28502:56-1078(+)|eukprot:CEM36165.1 unnamed protein product [Vitrella brassicaformis CCMP3155]
MMEELCVWQDREIKFDQPPQLLRLRAGETQIDSMNAIEDTKGNNGERGMMLVTNLRVIWTAAKNLRTNLSIGLNCITSVNIRQVVSKLKGPTQALFLMTKHSGTRFEFIFTSLVRNSPRLFTTILAVHRAYETSRLYRDLKLRGAIIQDRELVMLPLEHLYDKVTGIWNLSSDQGNLGTFCISNVRVVWFANLAENFNVSVPYLQMKSISVRNSKFGEALVIETTQASGGYILGFRADPQELLAQLHKQISNLHKVFSQTPVFGVEYSIEEKSGPTGPKMPNLEDDVQIVPGEDVEPSLLYYAEGQKAAEAKEPVFSPELGLAIEELREGATVDSLWSVI